MRWRLFNHCVACDARIPRRKRAFFGNSYRPVICTPCSDRQRASLYGSVAKADALMLHAAAELISEHPEMAKLARGLR